MPLVGVLLRPALLGSIAKALQRTRVLVLDVVRYRIAGYSGLLGVLVAERQLHPVAQKYAA